MSLGPDAGGALADCLQGGGIAVIPTDTVYGLACDPRDARAVERLYSLKERPGERPAAVMFARLAAAVGELGGLTPGEGRAAAALLPGPVTLIIANPGRRFPLACGPEPERLGLRVPDLSGSLAPLGGLEGAVLQSSANPSGGTDARSVAEIAPEILAGVDLILDAGRLPGRASSVVDLASEGLQGRWLLRREGAVSAEEIARALGAAGWSRGGRGC